LWLSFLKLIFVGILLIVRHDFMVIITMLYFRDNRDMSYNHMIYVLSPLLILSRILNLTTLPRILCRWSFCYATYLVNLDLIIVYCRLDITVRFVSVWWRTLQTTWIILMERNVCNFLACFLWFFSVYLVLIPFNSLMVILTLSPQIKERWACLCELNVLLSNRYSDRC
jgi:hypothetical protein